MKNSQSLVAALRAALEGSGVDAYMPAPGRVFSTDARKAMTREMLGMAPGSAPPAAGTPERTRWNSTMRNLQRAQAGEGKQRRGQVKGHTEAMRVRMASAAKAVRAQEIAKRIASFKTAGAVVHLTAWIGQYDKKNGQANTPQLKRMPPYGRGKYLNGQAMSAWLDLVTVKHPKDGQVFLVRGKWGAAAQTFLDEFNRVYGFAGLPDLIGEVVKVEIEHPITVKGVHL